MFISKCRCCPKSFSRNNYAVSVKSTCFQPNRFIVVSNLSTHCLKRKNKFYIPLVTLAKQHQIRTYWYEVLGNSKEQARGIKRKVSDLLDIVRSEIASKPSEPDYEPSVVSLCARTIPAAAVPLKYRSSLKPTVTESSFIKDSQLMEIPPKPKDYQRLLTLRELEEVNRVKRQFATSLHMKNASGMSLKSDGISYYMAKPQFYPSADLYEIPGLKTDLLRVKVPYKADTNSIPRVTDSETHYSKKTKKEIYFTPKRLRKYPD